MSDYEIKRLEALLLDARKINDRISIANLENRIAALRAAKKPNQWSTQIGW